MNAGFGVVAGFYFSLLPGFGVGLLLASQARRIDHIMELPEEPRIPADLDEEYARVFGSRPPEAL